jgi:hypothetical protein
VIETADYSDWAVHHRSAVAGVPRQRRPAVTPGAG